MTPLERAARAIWEVSGRPTKVRDTTPSMSVPEGEPDWERFLPQARAVLQELREAGDGMARKGGHSIQWPPKSTITVEIADEARAVWTAMIDAALEEG